MGAREYSAFARVTKIRVKVVWPAFVIGVGEVVVGGGCGRGVGRVNDGLVRLVWCWV